ncbi:MAG TPA: Fic family protein, partial [Limnochordia bacterium]|nr:Fic family protein [Limnochordia bacterium]
ARLAANLLLMAAGYPPAVITPQDRPAYYDALRAAQMDGELDPIVRLFIAAVERALIHYERLHRGV